MIPTLRPLLLSDTAVWRLFVGYPYWYSRPNIGVLSPDSYLVLQRLLGRSA